MLLGHVKRPRLKFFGIEGKMAQAHGRIWEYDWMHVGPKSKHSYHVTVVWTTRESFKWAEESWKFLLLEERD